MPLRFLTASRLQTARHFITLGLQVIAIDHDFKNEEIFKVCRAVAFFGLTKLDDKSLAEEVKKVSGGRCAFGHCHERRKQSLRTALDFLKPQGSLICIDMPEGTPVPTQSAFPARVTMN